MNVLITKPITVPQQAEYKRANPPSYYHFITKSAWLATIIDYQIFGGPILWDCEGPTIN